MNKEKTLFILTIIFGILALCGACFVLYNKGQVNAGYAVIPMLVEITFLTLYSSAKNDKRNSEKRK